VTARPGPGLELRQLLPEPATVTVGDAISSLNLGRLAHAHRPYTIVNFIASADGRASFHGHSRALGDDGDWAIFHGLRERVDAVFAGTGTLRSERYGRLVRSEERRSRRAAAGLAPDPLAVVVTRSGEVPSDIPLFTDPDSRIALFTPVVPELGHARAHVDVVRLDPGELTFTTIARRLRADFDVRSLLCEGGPMVFGALLQEKLVDELFLTLSPMLTGAGTEVTVTAGPGLAELVPLRVLWLLEREGFLFLRYGLG
jgi:5-amino-6-(5-phosphoribosylamino)uracil reductase